MPTSEPLLASFAASSAGLTSDKTLSNWLAGLHYWHVVNGAPWHGADMLHHVQCGFAKLVPPSSKRAKRPPVTIKAMVALKAGLNLSNAFDAAVWALACIWSCCWWESYLYLSISSLLTLILRLGELLIPSLNLFDPAKHVAHTTLPIKGCTLPDGITYATFHILWTKTRLWWGVWNQP
jgi:hypothetical protein